MPIRQRRCTACARVYELLDHRGQLSALNHDDLDHLTCPSCDSPEFEVMVGLASGVELGGDAGAGRHYPYFDRGLGCHIRSAQHRRQVMKQRGVRPTEGATGGLWEDIADQEASEAKRDDAAMAAQDRENREGPSRQEYHQVLGDIDRKLAGWGAQADAQVREAQAKIADEVAEMRARARHRRR